MPRYFFHCEGAAALRDTVGVEIADDQAARLQAIQFAGEVLVRSPSKFEQHPHWRMLVDNDAGETVFIINWSTLALRG